MTHHQQNFAHVESLHPGWTAVAGPYQVNHTTPFVQRRERAQCVRAQREQDKHGHKAKIVMSGGKAWVIRQADLLKHDKNKDVVGIVSIKNGRGGVKA